jgi:DNA (cytosine-5)-methyltransferase 1
MRAGVPPEEAGRLYDHITRPVREDDRAAFEHMTSETRYSQLPEELKRYRDDIFDDKYKRLDEDDLSRTITAHIARDGYWYIHPRQSRTLTVREAARLQTFPDHFRFAGPPSAAFRQIGNAVPPLLGERLGMAVADALDAPRAAGRSSRQVAALLAAWWNTLAPASMALPWLAVGTRWQLLCAEVLLERAHRRTVHDLWPVIRELSPPDEPGEDEAFEVLTELTAGVNRAGRLGAVSETRDYLAEHPGALDEGDLDGQPIPNLSGALADLMLLAKPDGDPADAEVPVLVTKGVLRVASRFSGVAVDRQNRLSSGRLAVARMIGGGGDDRTAHLGLIELAGSVCRPEKPLCGLCPLSSACRRHGVVEDGTMPLF